MVKKNYQNLFEYYGFVKSDEKKYPVVSRTLKKLTPAKIKKEIKKVKETKLPQKINLYINQYQEIGERNYFIWQWLWNMFNITRLPIVPKKYEQKILELKVLITMFIILLDDIADKKTSKEFLDALLTIPFKESFSGKIKNQKYFKKTLFLWKNIMSDVRKLPNYSSYQEIFDYDLRQVVNAMRYSYLVNKDYQLLNKTECWQFMPYNMVALVYSGLDLMCAKRVPDLGAVREIVLYSQKMARIGNWISTWEREVFEKDFANGIFAYALDSGLIKARGLEKIKGHAIIQEIRQSKIEKDLLKEWEDYLGKIEQKKHKFKNGELVDQFSLSLEKLIIFHLSSKGYK